MCYWKKHLKIFCAHIEWSTASMFIGLGSLVLALGTNNWPCWALAVACAAVIVIGYLAAHGAYTQKSIDRITQYDRDFKALKSERKAAVTLIITKSFELAFFGEFILGETVCNLCLRSPKEKPGSSSSSWPTRITPSTRDWWRWRRWRAVLACGKKCAHSHAWTRARIKSAATARRSSSDNSSTRCALAAAV
jgi:hypothetical protein